jgi:putative ABC transport system permease protein
MTNGALIENVRMSVRSIMSNAIRSLLTALGVMIGTGAVIGMLALGEGAQKSVETSLQSLGSNLLLVYSGQPKGGSLVRKSTTNIIPTITDDDIKAIRNLGPGLIAYAAPESSTSGQAKYGSVNMAVTIVGTDTEYPLIRNVFPGIGSFFTAVDIAARKPVVVIGDQLYQDFFGGAGDPVGQKLRLNGLSYKIAGVMQRKGDSTADTSVFIPISAFKRYISGADKYALVNIQAASGDVMRQAQEMIEQELLRLHTLPTMDVADFYIANQLDLLNTLQGVAGTFTLLLGGIAGISLIVGGIGIMNIMLVSVTERTREIGVRMALGAKTGDIISQFMTEAVILSVGGGLIGIALGFGSSWAFSKFGGLASQVTTASVVLSFGFSVLIGLFFGGYPAYRASRLNPIEALRYE